MFFLTESFISYATIKSVEKILSIEHINQLQIVINQAIEYYKTKYNKSKIDNIILFYESNEFVSELLKFRIFYKEGDELDINSFQSTFNKNPNILKPTEEELSNFLEIFDNFANNDEKLKSLELGKYYKKAIFEIYKIVSKIYKILDIKLIEIVPLLEEEYKEQINIFAQNIKEFKIKTALANLEKLEIRINENTKHVSDKLQANIRFYKGLCLEALGETINANKNFISAYKYDKDNFKFSNRALIAYYFLKDDKYKELKSEIEEKDDYNPICWAINTFEANNQLEYIKNFVKKNVLDNDNYKRIVFNYNQIENKENSLDLIDVLKVENSFNYLPDFIDFDNFYHWYFIVNAFSIKFLTDIEIPFTTFLEKNDDNQKLYELLKTMYNTIKGSEIEDLHISIIFLFFWFQSEFDSSSFSINDLKKAYESLKEKDALKTWLYLITIQKYESKESAIGIINKYTGEYDEYLSILKMYLLINLDLIEQNNFDYFDNVKNIDEVNIQITCFILLSVSYKTEIKKEYLLSQIEKTSFSKTVYKELLKLLIDSLFEKDKNIPFQSIKLLKDSLLKEKILNNYIALLYFENGYYKECIEFQESYIDENVESADLQNFIKSHIIFKESNQLKLLNLLKNWRLKFSFNLYFLKEEIKLQQILNNWEEIYNISKYVLSELKYEEHFFTLYITSLDYTNRISEINNELEIIKAENFKNNMYLIRVSKILIKNQFYQESLDLIYEKSIDKNNYNIRNEYIYFLTAILPDNFFKKLNKVEEDVYVKYEIDGKFNIIHINKEEPNQSLIQSLLGKSESDVIHYPTSITKTFKKLKIIKILNKYQVLFDEIINEVNNPTSNLPIESITIDSTNSEVIQNTFIENFVPFQEQEKNRLEKNFFDYQNYQISFFELVIFNFKNSFVDTYFNLTSYQNDGFFIKPLKYINSSINAKDKQLVIDFTSSLLFYELIKKLGFSFNKFIISANTYKLIDHLILNEKYLMKSKMSITISSSGVHPYIYPDDFYERRIAFLNELKDWFKDNTEVKTPEEKIQIAKQLYETNKMNLLSDYSLENYLLALREGYLLISDDIHYEKVYGLNNVITTEKFLTDSYPERKNDILEAMLSFRYMGISINSDVMYSTYIKQHEENFNYIYSYALRNLTLPINFDSNNIETAIDFLKKIALSSTITIDKFQSIAINLINHLVYNCPNTELLYNLNYLTEDKFKFLGRHLNIIKSITYNVLKIKNQQ